MNLIGASVKFRLIDQWGTVLGKYVGKLEVEVDSGHRGKRKKFIAVDFYIVRFQEGVFHWECSEVEDIIFPPNVTLQDAWKR